VRAIVTGGAGFIGSHLADRLVADGWEVVCLDDLSSGHEGNVPSEAELIEADCSDPKVADALPADGADAIFHLASHVGQEASFEKPVLDLQVNALATMVMLQWALARRVPKLVFASSMNVYGEPPALPATEDMPVSPPSPYAVGKIASEHLLRIYRTMGVQSASLRLFNTYGPRQDLANLKQGMVSIYMAYVARGEPILVRGSGDRFRDFVYVDDAVDAFVRCLEDRADGRVYNVATGRKTHVHELLRTIVAAFGEDPDSYPIDWADPTPNDQFGCYGDPARLREELGWEPRVALEDGVARMAEWAREAVPR
jgi:UDP-glucose 4-epimerase